MHLLSRFSSKHEYNLLKKMERDVLQTLCRLCLSKKSELISVFEKRGTQGWTAADGIVELLRFQVSEGDVYPRNVCIDCMGKLAEFKEFKVRCERFKELLDRTYSGKNVIELGEDTIERRVVHDESDDDNLSCISEWEAEIDNPDSECINRDTKPDIETKEFIQTIISIGAVSLISTDTYIAVPKEEHTVECGENESPITEYDQMNGVEEEDLISEAIDSRPIISELDGVLMAVKEEPVGEITVQNVSEPETSRILTNIEIPRTSQLGSGRVLRSTTKSTGNNARREEEESVSRCRSNWDTRKVEVEANVEGPHSTLPDGNPMNEHRIKINSSPLPDELSTNKDVSHENDLRDGCIKSDVDVYIPTASTADMHQRESTNTSEDEERTTGEMEDGGEDVSESVQSVESKTTANLRLIRLKTNKTVREIHSKAGKHFTNDEGKGNDFKFVCDYCSLSFVIKENLAYHIERHVRLKRRKYIGNESNNRTAKDKSSKNNECKVCHKNFPTPVQLKIHSRVHSGEKPYKCDVCEMRFSQKGSLKRHTLLHSDIMPFECKVCARKFRRKFALRDHMLLHERNSNDSTIEKFRCLTCGKEFMTKRGYSKHMKNHEVGHKFGGDRKEFQCSQCEKSYTHKESLRKHVTLHSGERSFICTHCDKSFAWKYNLIRHIKSHITTYEDKGYKCADCDAKFTRLATLVIHIRKHTGIKPYVCDICDERFYRRDVLNIHQRTHVGKSLNIKVKAYQCNLCKKVVSSAENLKIHKRTHTGETPYLCRYCGKGLSSKDLLVGHERIHRGEYPFPCTICDKRFASERLLKGHISFSHPLKKRVFKCDDCDIVFGGRKSFKKHNNQVHLPVK